MKINNLPILASFIPDFFDRGCKLPVCLSRTNRSGGVSLKNTALAMAVIATTFASGTAAADDIDVFNSNGGADNKPNLLLLFDMSGSMNWDLDGVLAQTSGKPSRADLLKEALTNVMNDTIGQVNLGVALWNSRSSGIKWPITDLALEANTLDATIPNGVIAKDVIENLVATTSIGGGTAPVNAIYEAAMYFRGGPVRQADVAQMAEVSNEPYAWDNAIDSYAGNQFYSANPITYTPGNAYNPSRESWSGAKYKSPLKRCQSNYMLLLTDGQPTVFKIQDEIEALIGKPCADLSTSVFGQAAGNSPYGNCGPELVDYLFTNDQANGIKGSHVGMHTIGLGLSGTGARQTESYMDLLAKKGGGGFYTVDNASDLQDAFNEIIQSIVGESENFTELTVDIDSGSLSNDNRAFFSLFKPGAESAWKGNTKGYFVDADGIVDINGLPATLETPAGTVFDGNAQSFWSVVPDGNKLTDGGVNSKLDPAKRTIVTYTDTAPPNDEPLMDVSNELSVANQTSRLSPALFGVSSKAQRDELITWLYNAPMGDPLHTKPVSVKYQGNKTLLFSMTNQGLLHAFDASTPLLPNADVSGGDELFAFMPKELLRNIKKLKLNTLGGDHIYGLDGSMTLWHDEPIASADGIVNNGEKAILYIGMRRGGTHYYALDVSNYQFPQLMWQKSAGDPGFERMAQSWSRLSLVSLYDTNYPDDRRRALVFGGGYDQPVLDDQERRKSAKGNAVYAIDAMTGDLIWSVSNTGSTEINADMRFAIASDLAVVDTNDNGLADRIYTGDLGGQLWRIDMEDTGSLGQPVKAKLLAQLGTDSKTSFQPFFSAPSVSLDVVNGEKTIYVAIGSGNRDQPLQDSASNSIFAIKDRDVDTGAASTSAALDINDLYDATENNIADPSLADSETTLLKDSDGWFVTLRPSEKALTEPLVYQNKLLFTTIASSLELDPATDCEVVKTEGSFYGLNLRDATALLDDGSGNDLGMQGSRSRVVSTIGIPSAPALVFPSDSEDANVYVGKTSVGSLAPSMARVYWYQQN